MNIQAKIGVCIRAYSFFARLYVIITTSVILNLDGGDGGTVVHNIRAVCV